MARTPQDVTDAELSVMQVLWEHGPLAIRRITDLLYGNSAVSAYATVQKLLERLEAKAYVERDRTGGVHVFTASVDRDALVGRRLRQVAEKLCGGSWTPLLTHLVQNQKLSDDERRALRQLIDELAPTEAKKGRRGKEAK